MLRLRPGVSSLQESAGAQPLQRLVDKGCVFLGARAGHAAKAGYVQLYARARGGLGATQLEAPSGLPAVMARVTVRGTALVFVACHLPAGEAGASQREKYFRSAGATARAAFSADETAGVVILGDGAKHSPLGGNLGEIGGPLEIYAPRCFWGTKSDFSH